MKGILNLREKSTHNHTGEAKYGGYVMLHEDELKALLVEEPIADPIPKKESNEKDTMSHINNKERSQSEGLAKDKLRATYLSKEMHTEEFPEINVTYIQDQCLMITKKGFLRI